MQEFSEEQLKQIILSLLPEVLSQYFQEKEKELKTISLLERIIRVEEELKALREEMKVRFEANDRRFESLLREMNARFEGVLAEQKALREEMNARFETIDNRFEALQREMNARFEALERRFNFMQWLIVVGFSFLAILITLFGFLKG